MILSEIFKDAPSIEIQNIMTDSRKVLAHSIFFCIKGNIHDAHDYVEQATQNGAVVIVHMDDFKKYDSKIIYIRVKDTMKSLVSFTAKFYGNPSEKLFIFGITGTNGKTSVASMIQNLNGHFEHTGYIGTLGVRYDSHKVEGSLTTPDIDQLNQILKQMVDENVVACAIEISSIGIEQHRTDNVEVNIAIFTNFTHDHLDYHGTMENYFNAKKMLFDRLGNEGIAIVNADDVMSKQIIENTEAKVYTYAIEEEADFQAKDIQLFADKTVFTLSVKGSEYRVESNLVARFNVYNLLAAIAALHLKGIAINQIIDQLGQLNQIDGRMERIDMGQPFNVIVDFAHTPDGIEKVMQYAKTITPKASRIIAVFGSAGKRDLKKRPIFGKLANQYCDMTILTEDDPRGESVVEIANQIAQGITTKTYIIIEDRYTAIRQAIELVNANDTILILGKGSETYMYQEFGKETYLGDDVIVREVIEKYYLEKGEKDDEIE